MAGRIRPQHMPIAPYTAHATNSRLRANLRRSLVAPFFTRQREKKSPLPVNTEISLDDSESRHPYADCTKCASLNPTNPIHQSVIPSTLLMPNANKKTRCHGVSAEQFATRATPLKPNELIIKPDPPGAQPEPFSRPVKPTQPIVPSVECALEICAYRPSSATAHTQPHRANRAHSKPPTPRDTDHRYLVVSFVSIRL